MSSLQYLVNVDWRNLAEVKRKPKLTRRELKERKKPEFIRQFTMDHVPPPDPANFWKMKLNDPHVILADTIDGEIVPTVTVTVREIKGDEVSLQITAHPKIQTFYKQ
jgi:hypothetical protein